MTADQIIDDVLEREKGYVDHPADRGGPTNFGISAAVLGIWRSLGRPATRDEVRALQVTEARDIYAAEYISRPGFGEVWYEPLKVLLVDAGVNHGQSTAIRWLQRALGFGGGRRVDGVMGRETKAAVSALSAERAREVYVAVLRERVELYLALGLEGADVKQFLRAHPTSQLANLRGWLRRAMEFAE